MSNLYYNSSTAPPPFVPADGVSGVVGKLIPTETLNQKITAVNNALTTLYNNYVSVGITLNYNNTSINTGLNTIGTALEGVTAYAAGLSGRVNTLTTRANAIDESIAGLTGSVSGLTGRANAIDLSVAGLTGRANAIDLSVAGLTGSVSGLTARANAIDLSVAGLTGSVAGLTARADAIDLSVAGLTGSVAGLTARANAIDLSVAGLTGSVTGLSGRATNLESYTQGVSGRVDTLRSDHDSLKTAINNTFNTDILLLQNKINAIVEQVNDPSASPSLSIVESIAENRKAIVKLITCPITTLVIEGEVCTTGQVLFATGSGSYITANFGIPILRKSKITGYSVMSSIMNSDTGTSLEDSVDIHLSACSKTSNNFLNTTTDTQILEIPKKSWDSDEFAYFGLGKSELVTNSEPFLLISNANASDSMFITLSCTNFTDGPHMEKAVGLKFRILFEVVGDEPSSDTYLDSYLNNNTFTTVALGITGATATIPTAPLDSSGITFIAQNQAT
jgi:uncharacterized protein YoxC